MDDRVIFNHEGVVVSYSHLDVNQKRFLIETMTGCEPKIMKPKYLLARLCMFGGLPLIFAGAWYPMIGLSLMLSGLVFFKITKIRYALIIQTLNGSYHPVISENILDIENVASALNVALVMRDSRKLALG